MDSVGENCCKGGKCDCCSNAILKCFLGGRDYVVSGIDGVMLVVMGMVGYWG